jgi:hypothetical protein
MSIFLFVLGSSNTNISIVIEVWNSLTLAHTVANKFYRAMSQFLKSTISLCANTRYRFWSSGAEPWPNIVPQEAAVSKVFGSRSVEKYGPGLTLLEATIRTDDVGGGAFIKLVKEGSAALLNAYTRKGFPFDSWEVKALLLEALVSEEAAAVQAERFDQANRSCI